MSNPFTRFTKMQLAVMAFAALTAVALPLHGRFAGKRAAAQAKTPPMPPEMPSGGMAMPQTLVCGLWRTSSDLVAKIHIKNALMVAPLAVTPTLYMADGTPYQLPPVEVPMSGEATVNINQALQNAPSPLGGHVSDYGSASLTYMWDGAGHVSASMNLKDLAHSLTFHQAFLDLPSSMGAGAGGIAASTGYERWQEKRERAVLASYRIPTPGARQERQPQQMQTPPLNGLWWKRDPGVAGYFALANTGPESIAIRYRLTGSAGADGADATVGLGPNASAIVPLDPLIASLPPNQRDAGGITVEQLSGPAMAMSASGWLENEREGFSASIEFEPGYMPQPTNGGSSGTDPAVRPAPSDANAPVTLAATGLMLGKPMSGAGFPGRLRFRPYGYLRNTARRPLLATVTANVATGAMGTPAAPPVSQSFEVALPPGAIVPVALAPLARRLEREMARKMGMDPSAIEGAMLNWSVSFAGHAGSVLMTTGSTDQTGNYVFEVMPVRLSSAVGLQLPYWNTAHGNDTMYSLWNPGAAAQKVVLTLYSADGMHTYAVPVSLAPGASATVDLGMLRQEGMPDPSGNLLPPEVEDGSAMLEPAAALQPDKNGEIKLPASGPAQMRVAVSVGIFNAQTATCCSQCMWCCFYTCPGVASGLAPVGSGFSSSITAEDCCGFEDDFTANASWISYNTSILTSQGQGSFDAVGLGETTIAATFTAESQSASGPYCAGGCLQGDMGGSSYGTAAPVISCNTSGCPQVWWFGGQAPSGYATQITLSATAGSTYSWTIDSGGAEINTSSLSGSTLAVISTGASFSHSAGAVSISVTVNGVTSAPFAVTPLEPYRLVPGQPQDSADATFGYLSQAPYTILDQVGNPLPSSISVNEQWSGATVNDDSSTNWIWGTAGAYTTPPSAPAAFEDYMEGQYYSPTPAPVPQYDGLAPHDPVQHRGQTWQIGSATPGTGLEVQSDVLQAYVNARRHLSIITPIFSF